MQNDSREDKFFSRILGIGLGVICAGFIWIQCIKPDEESVCAVICAQLGEVSTGNHVKRGMKTECGCKSAPIDPNRLMSP